MGLTRKDALRIMGGSAVAAGAALPFGGSAAAAVSPNVPRIRRDVCVIGGGSSGCYTAVRLRDMGLSVAVVERQDRFGGHTETFHDPITGGTTDIGVIVFHNLPLVRDYFARFDVPLIPAGDLGGGSTPRFIDFRTGKVVAGHIPPAPVALPTYLGLLQQYPYLDTGFDLPDPVPAQLLQPFGNLVTQAGLESIVPLIFNFGQGLGDLLSQPAIYVLKNVGLDVVANLLGGSFLTTAHRNNHELYEKIGAFLGADALVNANVVSVRRDSGGVVVTVLTPAGPRIIQAAKLVVAVPPLLTNLLGFDLDRTESSLFGRFRNSYYWTAVARATGLPADASLPNIGADTPFHLPTLPGPYGISATGLPNLYHVKYGSASLRTDRWVRADIATDFARLRAAGTFPAAQLQKLEIFRSHGPFELTVSPADIAAGFYKKLYGLQGHNRTYYTGAALHSHDSSLLWRFTEGLLPTIAA